MKDVCIPLQEQLDNSEEHNMEAVIKSCLKSHLRAASQSNCRLFILGKQTCLVEQAIQSSRAQEQSTARVDVIDSKHYACSGFSAEERFHWLMQ